MNRRTLFFPVLVLFLLTAARGEVFTVGDGGQFSNINSAIAAAKSGDEIIVLPGVYTENIILDKPLTIIGQGRPEIAGTGRDSVITVTASGCTVRGLIVRHSGGDIRAEDAGILLRSNSNIIENNELSDILFGIYLYGANNNFIHANTVTGRSELEVGERGAGLHLWNSSDNQLNDNVITQTRDGIYVQSSPRNTMNGNEVSGVRYGLHFMSSDENRFQGNNFHDNVAGAAIMYSRGIELRQNAFVHNRGFSSFGILFQDCRECVTENNLVANNATGIFAEGMRDSVFRRNTISENDVAAQIFSSSEHNTFTGNNFIDNISPLQMIGKSTSTAWSDGTAGNYWSDYNGYDMDGDSIGDVPFKLQNVFEYLEGSYPRIRIYLNSPAAQSVVAAERSFPIIEGSNQVDPKPLMRPVVTDINAVSRTVKVHHSYSMLIVSMFALALSLAVFWRRGRA